MSVTGEVGTARGIPADKVDRMLMRAVEWARDEGRADAGGVVEIRRLDLREWWSEQGHTADETQGLWEALLRACRPAIWRTGHGEWALDVTGCLRYLRHREWRLLLGKVDLPTADALVTLIERAEAVGVYLPPGAHRIHQQIAEAREGLT